MTFSEFTRESTPVATARPKCPDCTVPMYLARIAPDKPGYDLRTFECPRCQNILRAVAKLN
jgi:hypothetical protein